MAKQYEQALREVSMMLGEHAYQHAMAGSMQPWYEVSTEASCAVLGIVYNQDYETVLKEVSKRSKAHYEAHWPN